MTNADKFKNIFGLYATELWSMPEKDFLKWLNSEVMNCSDAIDAMAGALVDFPVGLTESYEIAEDALSGLPSAEPEIIRCKDCRNYAPYWGRCRHWERISTESILVSENDFCSRAERKDNG